MDKACARRFGRNELVAALQRACVLRQMEIEKRLVEDAQAQSGAGPALDRDVAVAEHLEMTRTRRFHEEQRLSVSRLSGWFEDVEEIFFLDFGDRHQIWLFKNLGDPAFLPDLEVLETVEGQLRNGLPLEIAILAPGLPARQELESHISHASCRFEDGSVIKIRGEEARVFRL